MRICGAQREALEAYVPYASLRHVHSSTMMLAFTAVVTLACSAGAQGQDIAQQVKQTRNGTVKLLFAAKPGVCGDGQTFIRMNSDDEDGEGHTILQQTRNGWNTMSGYSSYDYRRCDMGPVRVELEVENGDVVGIETFVGGRPPAGATTVSARAAVDYLLDVAEKAAIGSVGKHAMLPALLADSVEPAPGLLQIARNRSTTLEVRKSAVFWYGQSKPANGVGGLKSLLAENDVEISKQVTFALSQIGTDEAVTALIDIAKNQPQPEVRKQAIFWLGQAAGRKATEGLKSMLSDDDVDVRKQAVFALSQLRNDEGVTALIDVVKNNKDPAVRKQALFWLGQSKDPRVLALFEDILIKN